MKRQVSVKKLAIAAAACAAMTGFWLLLYSISFSYPQVVELYYSQGFYEAINSLLAWLFGWAGFSVGEIMVYAVIAGVLALVVCCVVLAIRDRASWWKHILKCVCALVITASVLVSSFVCLWGFNYAREPLADQLHLIVEPQSTEVLQEVCTALVKRANALRADLPEDENGVYEMSRDRHELYRQIPTIFNDGTEATDIAFAQGDFSPVKPVAASEAMCWAGIAGIYFPFTGESNICDIMPDVSVAAAALHETAHQAGYAAEAECEFLSYYVSVENPDDEIAYSGIVNALIHCTNSLYNADRDRFREVRELYSDALVRDLTDINEFYAQYEGEVEEFVTTMNDNYLKANKQADGVKSYGRMTDLMIALYLAGQL